MYRWAMCVARVRVQCVAIFTRPQVLVWCMKILFVCNAGMQRSPTAADMYAGDHETRSAGAYSTRNPLTCEDVAWADLVVCMEEHQREELVGQCPKQAMQCRIAVLGIPDVYRRGDEKLKKEITARMDEVLS